MTSTISVPVCSGGGCTSNEASAAAQCCITPTDYGTTRQLFDEIRAFFGQHPGLAPDSVLLLTHFILAVLFPECAGIWPFASVVAPDTSGSSLLLKMLSSVCLSPLHVGEVTLNALLTLPVSRRPTLLLVDQPTPSKELERVLRIMSRPGGRILHKGELYDLSFPTLVCTAEPLCDRWILDQALQIALTPIRGSLPKFDPQILNESARTLKGKLARYRELNLVKVRESDFDAPHFRSSTRAIASMLGAAIVDDRSLQRCMLMVLEAQDQDARLRWTDSIQAVMVEAILFLSHEGSRPQARIGEIATIAHGILKGRDESFEPDPRAAGHHLRALGLFSQRLGGAGRGIRFTNAIRRTIHELARAYDVRTKLENPACEFCAEARLRTGDVPERLK
jgi:hypothetical protein